MMLPSQHRAWTWQGSADPAALQLRELPLPIIEPGDLLVRNAVIGLNPVDWKVLGGDLVDWKHGHIPGVDGAGVVVAVGDGVPRTWIGQRVAYHQNLARYGSFAEYTAVRAHTVLRIPASVTFQDAASVPCPALTAWLAVEKLPASCQTLLVGGAGGSVAHHLVQLATRRGLHVDTLSHLRHTDRLQTLGASNCLGGPLTDAWDNEATYDAVIDTVSADHARWLAPALRANGHLVCVQDRLQTPVWEPFTRTLSMHEVALGASHAFGDTRTWRELVAVGECLLNDVGSGEWRPDTLAPAPFDDLAAHLFGLQQRIFSGKAIVLLPDSLINEVDNV
ncbi:alcohol dehydrogenase catalytic domain-containing protein [Pseudomonas gingeri]|uniref:alcohol dehydrogenase catalytic domain-containing protein n=1 Tax=Pseudomonas gingeri TaxID=117681 RepID=UPI0015A3F0B8|nr:alcohol dehydrogenase catalytic domain-containing protein [Pseudomonas gingeri]NWD74485.1 alcohol dehydrogenase catalytic domain-containing protein [Pseudomonas gingeri]